MYTNRYVVPCRRLKRYRSVLAAFLAVAAAILYHQNSAAESSPPTIGYITDLSGGGAFYGRYSVEGARLAQDDLANSSTPVRVLIEDHGFKGEKAATAASRLLTMNEVQAIVSEFSFTTLAIAPLVSQHPKVLFVGISPAVSFLAKTPNGFKSYLDYRAGCRKIASHWKERGVQRIGVLRIITESGLLCAEGALSVFPDAPIEEFAIGSDVRSQLLRFRSKKIEALIAPGFEGDALNLMRALKSSGWKPKLGFDFRDSLTPQVVHEFPDISANAIGFGFPQAPSDLAARLRARVPSISNKGMEAAVLGYLHVKQLAGVFGACREEKITCKVSKFSELPAEAPLGFQGWKDRVAGFALHLYRAEGDRSIVVE